MPKFLDRQPEEKQCKLMTERAKLTERDRAILDKALEDSNWGNYSLNLSLRRHGFRVSHETLKLHRRGLCICSKT